MKPVRGGNSGSGTKPKASSEKGSYSTVTASDEAKAEKVLRELEALYPDKTKMPAVDKLIWMTGRGRKFGESGTAAVFVAIDACINRIDVRQGTAKGGRTSTRECVGILLAMKEIDDGIMKRGALWASLQYFSHDKPWSDVDGDFEVYVDGDRIVQKSIDREGNTRQASISERAFQDYFRRVRRARAGN